ncbi:MAG TPA: histidine phosphatase family protein [Vicinamibacteria bacterium]|nr:histidine phosphatase family protein [Vicinamibacteria bacterium]
MRLLIIRHAIAVPHGTPGVAEDERPLTPRGVRRFRAAARGLARICPRPGVVLTSPLVRARQTADLAAAAWGRVEPRDEKSLAGGSFEEVAAAVERHASRKLVAIVGHEPQLSAILAHLLGSTEAERFTFKKGGAALVDVPERLAQGAALVWYAPPRLLRAAAGES